MDKITETTILGLVSRIEAVEKHCKEYFKPIYNSSKTESSYQNKTMDKGITDAQNKLVLKLQEEGYIDQNLQSESLSKKQAHEIISAAIRQKNIAESQSRKEEDRAPEEKKEEVNEEFPDY